jgi:hypothetical protein
MQRTTQGILAAVLLCAVFGNAVAEDKKNNREREALRKVQQQLQQATQERSALQEKLAAAEKEAQDLKKNAAWAKSRASAEGNKNKALAVEMEATKGELTALQTQKQDLDKRLADTLKRLGETEGLLADSDARRKRMEITVLARNQQVSQCEDKNRQLYETGRKLIVQWQNRSPLDTALLMEPFTKIRAVADDNLLEATRDKLDEHRLVRTEATP